MKKNDTRSKQYNLLTEESLGKIIQEISERAFKQGVPLGFAGNEQYVKYRIDYESEEERIKELDKLLPEGRYMIDKGLYTGKGGYIMFVIALERDLKQMLNEEARENKARTD